MVTLSLIFGGAVKLLFIEAIPLYILTNSVQGFQFLHILANTDFFFFYNRHPNWYKVASHCDFSLHFPNALRIYDVWHLFMWLLAICMSSVHFLWLELSHKQEVTIRKPERCSLVGLWISYLLCLIKYFKASRGPSPLP